MRRAAAWLQARSQLGIDVFARPKPAPARPEGGYVALMEACLAVLRHQAGRADEDVPCRSVIPDFWRLPDALAHVRAALAEHPEGGDLASFLPPVAPDDKGRPLKARAALASVLLAGLELAKEGTAQLAQDEMFGVVRLRSACIGVHAGERDQS